MNEVKMLKHIQFHQNDIQTTTLTEDTVILTNYMFIFDIENSKYVYTADGKISIPVTTFTQLCPFIPFAAWHSQPMLEKGTTYKFLNCSDMSLFKDIRNKRLEFENIIYENGRITSIGAHS